MSRTELKLSPAAFEDITYTSQASSPTGTYQATAYLVKDATRNEVLGSTSFTVQEFEPDRMKVRLDLSEAPIEGWLRTEDVSAKLHADHLFGEPASARRVEGELSLTAVLPRFARYPDHRFQIGEVIAEPSPRGSRRRHRRAGRRPLPARPEAFRRPRLSPHCSPARSRPKAAATSRRRAAPSSRTRRTWSASRPTATCRSCRAASRAAQWLAVNQRLAPVAADQLTLEWVQRKYVSVLTRQGNGTLRYVSQLRETVRDSKPARIAAGGTPFPLPTQEPGDFVLVLRNAAGSELNRVSYSVAGQANLSRSLERNTELQVQLDKPSYAAGDTIAVASARPSSAPG